MKDSEINRIFERNVPGSRDILVQKTVGIAGCGGSGSNAAVALARAGVGRLIIADCDIIEVSNLNRQYFFIEDIGRKKADALAAMLNRINPGLTVDSHVIELTRENLIDIFAEADLLIEAFDKADSKHWLIETWCSAFPLRPMVGCSGLSGYGRTGTLRVRSAGNIHMCGDGETDMSMGLTSARVAVVANMQANVAIELLIDQHREK